MCADDAEHGELRRPEPAGPERIVVGGNQRAHAALDLKTDAAAALLESEAPIEGLGVHIGSIYNYMLKVKALPWLRP